MSPNTLEYIFYFDKCHPSKKKKNNYKNNYLWNKLGGEYVLNLIMDKCITNLYNLVENNSHESNYFKSREIKEIIKPLFEELINYANADIAHKNIKLTNILKNNKNKWLFSDPGLVSEY